MRQIWFKRAGWLYVPVHGMGLLITLLVIIFLVPVCATVLSNGHPVIDNLYELFVYVTCAAFWWMWVARKTS